MTVKNKRYFKQIVLSLLSVLLIAASMSPILNDRIFAESNITELEKQIEERNKNLESLKSEKESVQQSIDEQFKTLNQYKNEIKMLEEQIVSFNVAIEVSEDRIASLTESINERQKSIEETDNKVKQYMLTAQSNTRVNAFFEFIMGGSDFSEIVRRYEGMSAIKRYNEDLVRSIMDVKMSLEADRKMQQNEQDEIQLRKENIVLQKEEVEIYEKKIEQLVESLHKKEADIQAQEQQINYKNDSDREQIADTLKQMQEEIDRKEKEAKEKAEKEKAEKEKEEKEQNNSGTENSGNENEEESNTNGNGGQAGQSSNFGLPLYSGVFRITSSVWEYSPGAPHNGLDLGVDVGNDILAVADGIIVTSNSGCSEGARLCGGGYGNYVSLIANVNGHNYGILYAHLSSTSVSGSTVVSRGHILGQSGNTGTSTGPHLHIETIDMGSGTLLEAWDRWNGNMNFIRPTNSNNTMERQQRCDQGYGAPCRLNPQNVLGIY